MRDAYQENHRMSLVFAGSHAAFHHQYFQMVGALIHHFEMNAKKLNPYAKLHEPKKRGGRNHYKRKNATKRHKSNENNGRI